MLSKIEEDLGPDGIEALQGQTVPVTYNSFQQIIEELMPWETHRKTDKYGFQLIQIKDPLTDESEYFYFNQNIRQEFEKLKTNIEIFLNKFAYDEELNTKEESMITFLD